MFAFLLSALVLADAGLSAAHAQQSRELLGIDRQIKDSEPRMLPGEAPALPDMGREAAPADAVTDFTLSGVVIEGATAIEPARFAPLYEEFLATTVGSKEVSEILRRVTELYQVEGYFLTTAEVPQQAITAGVMRVRVIEGYISQFSVTGDESKRDLVERYVRPVLEERPARLDTVERALLLMEDLPGITVTPSLVPVANGAGEYQLVARIDSRLVDASTWIDNRGIPEIGRLRGFLSGALNDALGLGESTSATFFTNPIQPEEILGGNASATVPVGNAGTYVWAFAGYAAADPGSSNASLDTEARLAKFIGRIWHPLIRARQQSLWLTGAFDYLNYREQHFGDTVISDRTRTFRAGAIYALTDAFNGDNQVRVELSQGVDFLGASDKGSPTLSRADGQSEFTKLYGNVIRLQKITDRISVQLGVAGQWSADPLLALDEFILGGEQFGRAYDYGEVTGDDGVAGSGELRFGDVTQWPWLSEYQIYGFYDIGAVWNEMADGGSTRDSLTSAGGGLRLMLTKRLRATFEAAKPLTRTVQTTDDKDWRFFFSTSVTY